MLDSLINLRVMINLSDPWELGEARHWEPLEGVIINEKIEGTRPFIIIQLKESFEYKNVVYEYFIASARHVDDSLKDLSKGKAVFSSFTRIPPEQIMSSDPFDLSWWRGGIGLIGEIVVI